MTTDDAARDPYSIRYWCACAGLEYETAPPLPELITRVMNRNATAIPRMPITTTWTTGFSLIALRTLSPPAKRKAPACRYRLA